MAGERLTPLDASFLHLEDSDSHMHVACVMVFAGAPPGYAELLKHLSGRLHLVPRYRKRLATVPFGQGRPLWVDDEDFDLRFHVRRTALPAPGTETELEVLAGRVFSQPLRRDRPLWEIWLVEGLAGKRFALFSKTHHALVDGVSGLDILSVLFAPEAERSGAAEQWRPSPAPSPNQLLAEALLDRATMPAEGYRAVRAVLRRPRRLTGEALSRVRGASALASAGLSPAPATPFNEALIGPDRRFTWVRASLDDVKSIKNSLGGTVNDVVLAVVTGALRRYLLRRDVDVAGMTLKALVPISIRTSDESGSLGNKVSGMIAPLPVSESEPVASLQQITSSMARVKSSGQAIGAQALTELSGFAPANLMSQAGRVVPKQRFINLVITNVPGPQFALSMAGREMLDIFPMVPLGRNLALGIAIVSYNGTLNFGLVGDFKIMHDLEALTGDVTHALAELEAAAGVKRKPAHSSERSSSRRGVTPRKNRAASNGRSAESAPLSEPWSGYDTLTVAKIRERLRGADPQLVGAVQAYEQSTKRRRTLLRAGAGRAASPGSSAVRSGGRAK